MNVFQKIDLGRFVWCERLLSRYLSGEAYKIVLEHGLVVAELALELSINAGLDRDEQLFVSEAAILHDIGVARIYAPKIGCFGDKPYITHGILGQEILTAEGYPRHAMVCERHIGVGLTVDDIVLQKLPLPLRDMSPVTVAEKLICLADLFYSKKPGKLTNRKSVEKVRNNLAVYGAEKVLLFDALLEEFGSILMRDNVS